MIYAEGNWSTSYASQDKFVARTALTNIHTEVGYSTRSWELQSADSLSHTDPCLQHANWELGIG